MNKSFELPVQYNQEMLLLPAKISIWEYGHRIIVNMEGQDIVFEPDEERNYRAVVPEMEKPIDIYLLKLIAESIESIFK